MQVSTTAARFGLALVLAPAAFAATIIVPAAPRLEELQAAADLRLVWQRGTGEMPRVRREHTPAGPDEAGPWFFVGETQLAHTRVALPAGLDADGFRVLTLPGRRLVLHGATPAGTALAAGWFAQHILGVRWFWPGKLGEHVPMFKGWQPPALDRVVSPAFISRAFSGLGAGGEAWARHNGLHDRLPHSHALLRVFPATLFDVHPVWFPLLDGRRHRPAASGDYNWQPNLALLEVAEHAAAEANAFFDRNPAAEAFSLSINDSMRFDQSEATLRVREPLRWFRGRPDYADLVFGFMNRAADDVARQHPGKLLSAYAYYWCENTPAFPVRANIVPWLTADRTQWYDAAFAAEDRALIERWCRSGARVVGIYDYLYGSPFLVPRVTTGLTAESIRFAYHAGVRAYYAEAYTHGALDSPKLWVAAQLLWDPQQSVDALTNDYYRHCWQESAAPMRRFFEGCERAWREQSGPGWWLKYYNDEAQARLFSAGRCAELRACLDEAGTTARQPVVRARVAVVSKAFAVTERFVALCEVRDALSNAAAAPEFDAEPGIALLNDYWTKRAALMTAYKQALAAGAFAPVKLDSYLRNDPAPRAVTRLLTGAGAERESLQKRITAMETGAGGVDLAAVLFLAGKALRPASGLRDPAWQTLAPAKAFDDRTFVWNAAPWHGTGEPAEGRMISMRQSPEGLATLRFEHCKNDRLEQWMPTAPGKIYRASVSFRGRVSPGDCTFLMLDWSDKNNRSIGKAVEDRLPPGDWVSGCRNLQVAAAAPSGAAWAGVELGVVHQVSGDFSEFWDLSFTRSP